MAEKSGEFLRHSEVGLAEFLESMPSGYAHAFGHDDVIQHAGIVARRAGAPAHAEIWKSLPNGSAAVCVVADDRPGLLAKICSALVAHHLDVMSAQIYCRKLPEGATEALDLFWVRAVRDLPSGTGRAVTPQEIGAFARLLSSSIAAEFG